MSNLKSFFTRLGCMLLCLGYLQHASAQVYSTLETGNQFTVQMELVDPTPLSLEQFVYTVFFTLPNGSSPNTMVEAHFSPELEIVSHNVPASYGGNVTIVSTPVNSTGSRVSVSFPNQNVGPNIQGSFQVVVRFPLSKACHGLTATSWATLKGSRAGTGVTLITSSLLPECQITNPWRVQKRTFSPSFIYQGAASPCKYGTYALTNTVGYQIRIHRSTGDTLGSVLLSDVNLNDLVGSGQIIASGFQVAYDVSPFTPLPGFGFTSSGQITVPSGFQLDPLQPNYRIRFNVQYPSNLSSQCTENIFVVKGKDPCDNIYTASDTIGVKKLEVSGDSLVLSKSVTVNGNVPGCTGRYTITVRNPANATEPLFYNLIDTFPDCVILLPPYSVPTNGSVSGTFPVFTLSNISSGVGLAPNASHTYYFDFEIGNDCIGAVKNTVTSTGAFNITKSATFHMLPEGARPCINKSVCTGINYGLGDTVRYRIRVQNIGNTVMTGASITDILDPVNLEFIGNMIYYVNPTANNVPCGNGSIPSTATPWNGVGFTQSGNELTWTIPDIGVECSTNSNAACGGASNSTAYFIEFNVRIKDTAAIGSVKNLTTISGGNITTPVSHNIKINVLGNIEYNLAKGVSDSTSNFTNVINSSAGNTVYYNLQINNSGTGLSNAMIVDLLPNDNGSADNLIIFNEQRSPAGSYDINFLNFVSSSHMYIQPRSSVATGINTTPELGVTVNTNAPSWANGLNVGASNFQLRLNETVDAITPSSFIFSAKVSDEAKVDSTSCNTFAIRARSKRTSNSSISYHQLAALESLDACVRIDKPIVECCEPIDYEVPKEVCIGEEVTFCAVEKCEEGMIVYNWYVNGVFIGEGKCITYAFSSVGTYDVTVKWRNNCGKEGGKRFSVTVKECPCKIEVKYMVDANGLTVTGSAAGTIVSGGQIAVYTWDMGNGVHLMGQNITYTYPQAGSYEVILRVYAMDSKGEICECQDKCGRKVEVAVGKRKRFNCPEEASQGQIILHKPEIKVNAAPNPFVERLTVSFDGDKELMKGDFNLEMMNANGAVVLKRPLKDLQKPVELDTRNLTSGMYFVLLKDAKGTVQGKQVVKLQ